MTCFLNEYNNNLLAIGTEDKETEKLVRECHGTLPTHTVVMKPIEAELMKYFSNSYKAMRVTFANAFYRLCNEVDANYDVVKDAFLFHGVGDGHYLRVNKKFGGFGGTCLPKDTNSLLYEMEDIGMKSYILKSVINRNEKKDRVEKDWLLDKGRTIVKD